MIQQYAQGWGARVLDRLSQDKRQAFPGMTGFSARNLKYMRAFAEAWPGEQFVQQVAAQIALVSPLTSHWTRDKNHFATRTILQLVHRPKSCMIREDAGQGATDADNNHCPPRTVSG